MSVSLPCSRPLRAPLKKAETDRFVAGLFIGAFLLLLGFIAGAVTSSLQQPPSDIVIPLVYDCTTDSECEGIEP